LTKENLRDFLNRESCPGFELEVLAEHDLFRMIEQFFNACDVLRGKGVRARRAGRAGSGKQRRPLIAWSPRPRKTNARCIPSDHPA